MDRFKHFHFKGQKEGEAILLVVHRHWFDILKQFSLIIGMLLLMIGGFFLLPPIFPFIGTPWGGQLFLLAESTFAMFTWITFFLIWIDYYFDVWIITNKRIVNIEQKGLFVRSVSELEHENIQDVSTDVSGVIPTFLNYGDVHVQTAAEQSKFLFRNVPDPYGIKDLLMNLQRNAHLRSRNVPLSKAQEAPLA